MAIAFYDRGLLCVWEDTENTLRLEEIPFCTRPHELNYDYVAVNDMKIKRLKLTNVNPVNITIETVSKQQLDDLNIFIDRVVDRNGKTLAGGTDSEALQSILGPKRTKRLINFTL